MANHVQVSEVIRHLEVKLREVSAERREILLWPIKQHLENWVKCTFEFFFVII